MIDLKRHFSSRAFLAWRKMFLLLFPVASLTNEVVMHGWPAAIRCSPLPCAPAKPPHTICSIEKPAHFHLEPALFIFLSELVTINIMKSHKSRWCGLELPAVLPLVNCLSCPAAWLPEKASHQFPMVSLHFFTSYPYPEIFSTFTVDIYIKEREAKQIGDRKSKNPLPQKLRIIFQITTLTSQQLPSFHPWKETTSRVQLIFTNSLSQETYS